MKYQEIEEIVLENLKKMCKEYLNCNVLEQVLKNSDKLKKKKENILFEITKIENNINNLNKKIDACYNDKLEGNITLDMYKRAYNNFTTEIQANETKKENYNNELYNLENNNITNDEYYTQKIQEFLDMENPSRALITTLIDKIEIDEDKNIDIYYKFKLI